MVHDIHQSRESPGLIEQLSFRIALRERAIAARERSHSGDVAMPSAGTLSALAGV